MNPGRSIAAAALLAFGAACASEEPLRFAVTFDDAGGIERGDDVYYKGLEIGEVQSVGVDADGNVRAEVEVAAKYSDALTTSSSVEIERAGILGGRQLTVRDGDGPRQPLRSGDVLAGSLGPLTDAVSSLRDMSAQALGSLRQQASDLQERLRAADETTESDDPASNATANQLAELRAALEDLQREASEAAAEDRDQSADPEVEKRIEAVREQLEILRQKLASEGEELRQQVQPLLEDVERWLRRTPESKE